MTNVQEWQPGQAILCAARLHSAPTVRAGSTEKRAPGSRSGFKARTVQTKSEEQAQPEQHLAVRPRDFNVATKKKKDILSEKDCSQPL